MCKIEGKFAPTDVDALIIIFFFLVKQHDILKHKRDYKLATEAKVMAICL